MTVDYCTYRFFERIIQYKQVQIQNLSTEGTCHDLASFTTSVVQFTQHGRQQSETYCLSFTTTTKANRTQKMCHSHPDAKNII